MAQQQLNSGDNTGFFRTKLNDNFTELYQAKSNITSYLPLSGGTITGDTKINANLTVVGNLSATGSYYGNGSNLTGMLELGNLQIPDILASVIAKVYGPISPVELQLDGTYNGKPRYTGIFGSYNYSVTWNGTNWQAPAGTPQEDYEYGDSIATGDTQYPWQATGWTNSGGVTRAGTYNATLAPAPLSAYAYSGISTKAAREDHVHPLPAEANSWNSAYTSFKSNSASYLKTSTASVVIAQPGDNITEKYAETVALSLITGQRTNFNRATLILLPGEYPLNDEPIFNEEFVDVIALGSSEKKPSVFIENSSIHVTANDVRVVGISTKGHPFNISGGSLQVFENCSGGNNSFGGGGGVTASGNFVNCTGGDQSFGGVGGGNASGTFTNCIGGFASFGATSIASGNFTNCTGGEYSFGGAGGASGAFTNCTGGEYSFGGDGGIIDGELFYCKLTNGTFSTPYGAGIIRLCIDGNNDVVNAQSI
jgi:hypothetical protein